MAVRGATRPLTQVLRKKQLIEDVVARCGVRKKYAKPVVEAMLEVLGEAIGAGARMNLQPLGKVIPQKSIEKASGQVSILRIRQSAVRARKPAKEPLARVAE